MQRHLFLTGPMGSGKSRLLRSALGSRLCEAGGFITECLYGAEGDLTGLALSPAAAAAISMFVLKQKTTHD